MKNLAQQIKRYAVFLLGIYIMTAGIILTLQANLGTTPLSTLPNVASLWTAKLSFSEITFIWNLLLLAGQILILRRNFQYVQLLQLPLSFLFSLLLDVNQALLAGIQPQSFWSRLLLVCIASFIIGFSISLTVLADVLMNGGEAIVKAVSDTWHLDFGHTKIVFDVFYVLAGLLWSLLVFHGIRGIGIGTAVCALTTGFFVNLCSRFLSPLTTRFFTGKAK